MMQNKHGSPDNKYAHLYKKGKIGLKSDSSSSGSSEIKYGGAKNRNRSEPPKKKTSYNSYFKDEYDPN